MTRTYTPDDIITVSDLKALPDGSIISSTDADWWAIKVDYDEWTFDDRIDRWNVSSFFIANNFDGLNFTITEG